MSKVQRKIIFDHSSHRLYVTLEKTDSDSQQYVTCKTNLRTYNTILNRNIRMAKKIFYCSLFEKYKNDIKKTWLNVKEILTKKEVTKGFSGNFHYNGKQASDKARIAVEFNKYFSQIGP